MVIKDLPLSHSFKECVLKCVHPLLSSTHNVTYSHRSGPFSPSNLKAAGTWWLESAEARIQVPFGLLLLQQRLASRRKTSISLGASHGFPTTACWFMQKIAHVPSKSLWTNRNAYRPTEMEGLHLHLGSVKHLIRKPSFNGWLRVSPV